MDNEGGIWTHTGEAPRPGPGEPEEPAVSAPVSLWGGSSAHCPPSADMIDATGDAVWAAQTFYSTDKKRESSPAVTHQPAVCFLSQVGQLRSSPFSYTIKSAVYQ